MPGCCVQRWSLSLGRWWGVRVYLHIFFLLFALLPLWFALTDTHLMWSGLMAVGILLASVALHELAHALAVLKVGGKVDAIVLGPVGGLIAPAYRTSRKLTCSLRSPGRLRTCCWRLSPPVCWRS